MEKSASQTDPEPATDDLVTQIIAKAKIANHLWDEATFEALCASHENQQQLPEIYNLLPDHLAKRQLLRCAFHHCGKLPRKTLATLWNIARNDTSLVENKKPDDRSQFTEQQREKMVNSIRTDPLLIDVEVVCRYYIYLKKPGWEMLSRRFSCQLLYQPPLTPQCQHALQEDCAPMFRIACDLADTKLDFGLLREIIKNGAVNILRDLLETRQITPEIIPLDELCCLIAARPRLANGAALLAAIEDTHPGLLQSVHAIFGRNILWYAIRSPHAVTEFLLQHGCDPLNTNQLGLTWQEAYDERIPFPIRIS